MQNRRQELRFAADLKVEMLVAGLKEVMSEVTANISQNGLFVCSSYEAKIGEIVHMRIILKDKNAYFEVKSKVMWTNREKTMPIGFGVKFIDLIEEQKMVIKRFLGGYTTPA